MRNIKIYFMVLAIFVLAMPAAWASEYAIGINQSSIMEVDDAARVAIANPEIADVLIVSRNEVLVIGKKAGTTTLHIWQQNGQRQSFDVLVDSRDTAATKEINSVLGMDEVNGIKAIRIGTQVVLEGVVRDQIVKERAEKLAAAYAEKVINLLEISNPIQVKLEAKILEIATDKAKTLGLRYGNNVTGTDGAGTTLGANGTFNMGQSQENTQRPGSIFGWFGSYADINVQLNALIENGDAKILSQPNVVTMSGQKANVLIGGQIPVPTSNQNGNVTVEWRDYGIKLDIEPQVDSKGLILSTVKAEVSSIDYASALAVDAGNGVKIPPLKTRRAESVITLESGSTMAIGGLISSDESKQISKIPFLGDLPILGQFFRSTSTTKTRTEIVILITPTLVTAQDMPRMSSEMKMLKQGSEDFPDIEVEEKERDGK